MLLQRSERELSRMMSEYPAPEDVDYRRLKYGCYSAAIAYIMYRINARRELWLPSAIDEITDRKPGERTTGPTDKVLLALLEQGAEITDIAAFDNVRLIHEGLSYLEEYHRDDWLKKDPKSFYRHWTAERVDREVESVGHFLETVVQYGSNWQTEHRVPTLDDFRAFLADRSHVVLTYIKSGRKILGIYGIIEPGRSHLIVAVDYFKPANSEEEVISFFDNNLKQLFDWFKAEDFYTRAFLPRGGLMAVRVNDMASVACVSAVN